MAILLFALLFLTCTAQKDHFYRGFQVLRVNVTSKEQLQLFSDLEAEFDDESFDLWTYPNVERQVPAVVCVSPSILTQVKALFDDSRLQYVVSVADLQSDIDQETSNYEDKDMLRRKRRATTDVLQEMMATFPRYAEQRLWLRNLARTYPNYVELVHLGSTFEKRVITGVHISDNQHKSARRIIFIDGGMHAREHLSVSTCNYLISVLLQGMLNNDTEVHELMQQYDVVIVPILNPDGYETTHTGKRFWRKNRKQSRKCIGVDVNRNFETGYETGGSREINCNSLVYRGERAFSEKESVALQKFVMNNLLRMDFYFNLHAYSQYILLPWGYTTDPVGDYDDLLRVAQAGADAIKTMFNETFVVGVPPVLLYPAPGTAMDWVKAMGVKYSYSIEVRPGSDSKDGFLATIDMIKPSGDDIFVALKAMVRAANNNSNTSDSD